MLSTTKKHSDLVTIDAGIPVTTTLAIAEGTKTEHASAINLVRTYQNDLEEFGIVDFKSTIVPGRPGRPVEFAQLNEQQATLILAYMKNSPIVRTFKKGLVKSFFEIAKQLKHRPAADLNDPDTLRGLLLNYSAEVKTLRESVSEQAPVVKAFNLLETATDGSMCITDAAKQLQVRPKDLFSWLNHNRWTFRRGSVLTAYQQRIQQGVLECKVTHIKTEDGRERVCLQVLVTPKGLAALAIEMQQPIAA